MSGAYFFLFIRRHRYVEELWLFGNGVEGTLAVLAHLSFCTIMIERDTFLPASFADIGIYMSPFFISCFSHMSLVGVICYHYRVLDLFLLKQ